jgi:hypothetical protein
MAKTEKALKTHSKTADNGRNISTHKTGQKRKKAEPKEPTANELMMKAWKKLYESRNDRLL